MPAAGEPPPGAWLAPADFEQIVRLTPLVAIDLVVRAPDGRALVGRRVNEPAKGLLFVPGSRITKNETLAAAFRRITREELGFECDFAQARLLGAYDHLYATNRFEMPGFGTHYVTLGYEFRLEGLPDQLPVDQHHEYLWLTPAEILARTDVHPNTQAYFKS
jgi:colanic acid biosynthesis protein WcaH